MNLIFLFIVLVNLFSGTAYLWDQDRLVGEIRPHETIYYLYEPEGFVPIAQVRNDRIYYYHTDPLGTPHAMTDERGKIVWQADYGLFGAIETVYKSTVDNPLRFQGQYFDRETGLHYNRYRYYHPVTGRFISQDPIGFEGGLNLYQYAPNPLNWVDPLGLMCKETPTKRADFEVTANGTAIPTSKTRLEKGFKNAGLESYPSKKTAEAGTIYNT